MKFHRTDRALASAALPSLRKIEGPECQAGDVLVLAAGFEERALAVLSSLEKLNVNELLIICIEYLPQINENQNQKLQDICDRGGWNYLRLTYDRCDPAGAYSNLESHLHTVKGRIFIDISGMSRLLIVQLLVGIMRDVHATNKLSVFYTEANWYPPDEDEATALLKRDLDSIELLSFISTGVLDLAVVPELSSISLYRAPIRLIAFPSFNPTQLLNARANIQPAQLTLIHGTPPDPELRWRKEAIAALNRLDKDLNREDIEASTLHYNETLAVLLDLYDRWAEFNTLVISPTGSKMQTVAVAIFRSFVSDIQIVYPTPLKFTDPSAHTRGAKSIYELRLDDLAQFCRTLLDNNSNFREVSK
jgi:hypothetical protein